MKLSVVNVQNYNKDEINSAVDNLFVQLGGVTQFIGNGKNVFIKVNLVRDLAPEKAGTTHPEVVRAVASKIIAECPDCTVTVGDSSSGPYTKARMSAVYRATKMDYACAESGASLNMDFDITEQSVNGLALTSTPIISAFCNADVVINIGKLKTHSFTGYTGCVKNLYGLIPGLVKVETHAKYPDIDSFVDCLIDIEEYARNKISLHILDGVIGMDGEGPTNGNPKYIGKLIAGDNPFMVDTAGVCLFGNPYKMPVIARAVKRGIISEDFSETDFDFNALKADYIADFNRVEVLYGNFLNMPKWMHKIMKNALRPKVAPDASACQGCGKCVLHCPAKAVTINGKRKAVVDNKKCIRCYCCQELCPHNAVKLKKSLIYRVFRRFSHGKNKDKHLT